MKETTGEFGEIIERVERAFQEYREAKKAHDDWLREWRERNDIPQPHWEKVAP
jgi:hypothetical protein